MRVFIKLAVLLAIFSLSIFGGHRAYAESDAWKDQVVFEKGLLSVAVSDVAGGELLKEIAQWSGIEVVGDVLVTTISSDN
jgi:hypothetical protein